MEKFVKKMGDAEYDALPALRSTLLKEFIRSPAHYEYAMSPEARADNDRKSHFLMGNLIHAGLLEPETIANKYVICDESSRRTKAYKELEAKYSNKKIVLQSEREDAEAVIKAVRKIVPIMDMLEAGSPELAAAAHLKTGIGEETVYCKAKLDLFLPEQNHIVDIKTTAESAADFRYRISSYGYDVSAAFYIDVMEANGYTVDKFTFLVIEKHPPYGVMQYFLSPEDYTKGQNKYLKALPYYLHCLRTGQFPGYTLEPQPTFRPKGDGA